MAFFETRGLTRYFGGLRAVSAVDLAIEPGQIVSLIGPNGAGKTTIFNLISGLYRPSRGDILFESKSLVGLSPDQIAARGVGRTFQNIRVFPNLSVLENVMVGAHCHLKAHWFDAVLRTRRTVREEARVRERARDLLHFFGPALLARSEESALNLSYADRRRTEMARALAIEPKLLLLDEPTAGMNEVETTGCINDIRRICALGITIILIEHKLKVVMSISDHVVVLDHGETIAAGRPEEVSQDDRVIEAYLGRRRATTHPRRRAVR